MGAHNTSNEEQRLSLTKEDLLHLNDEQHLDEKTFGEEAKLIKKIKKSSSRHWKFNLALAVTISL